MDRLQPGDPAIVGGYRLLGRLGAGGMGQVFLGESPGGRMVAVKLIHPAHAGTPHFRERFAREIQAARRVGGFHTAPVVDADPHADPPWMVTAYIEGPSLQDGVTRYGPMPPERLRALGAGLAEGLAAIHASGLVHRDLKPANVILAVDGPRIIDFGIARAVDATTGLTTTGAVVGTISYMSPEQIRSEPVGPASDVFSLGCVLAFAATGRPPFPGDSAAAVMFRIVNDPPDLIGVTEPGLAGLIGACLVKTVAERPGVPAVLGAFNGRGAVLAAGFAPSAAPGPPRAAAPTRGDGPAAQAQAPHRDAIGGVAGTAGPFAGAAGGFAGATGEVAGTAGAFSAAAGTGSVRAAQARPGRRRPGRRLRGKALAAWVSAAVAVAMGVTVALAYGVPALTGRTAARVTDFKVTGQVPLRDRTLSTQVGAQFGGISFSPDGRLLAAGSGGHAYLWNLTNGLRLATLDDPGDGAGAEAFSPSGKLLADGDSVLNKVYLWDTANGLRDATLTAPGSGGIDGVAFSPDGRLLAAGDSSKHVYVWNVSTGQLTLTLTDVSIDGGVAFSPDGKLLAAAGLTGRGGPTYLWNTSTGKLVTTLRGPSGNGANAVAFSPDGKLLAAGSSAGVWEYNLTTMTDIHTIGLGTPGQPGPINAVAFSRDGTLLAAADGNGHAYVWNVTDNEIVGTYTGTGSWPVWGVAFSPDGKLLAVADGDGNVYVLVRDQFIAGT